MTPAVQECEPQEIRNSLEALVSRREPEMADTSLPQGGAPLSGQQAFGASLAGIKLELGSIGGYQGLGFSLPEEQAAALYFLETEAHLAKENISKKFK